MQIHTYLDHKYNRESYYILAYWKSLKAHSKPKLALQRNKWIPILEYENFYNHKEQLFL